MKLIAKPRTYKNKKGEEKTYKALYAVTPKGRYIEIEAKWAEKHPADHYILLELAETEK